MAAMNPPQNGRHGTAPKMATIAPPRPSQDGGGHAPFEPKSRFFPTKIFGIEFIFLGEGVWGENYGVGEGRREEGGASGILENWGKTGKNEWET